MASNKKAALGRGLDAILIDNSDRSSKDSITMLRIGDIEPNRSQPRKDFDASELEVLAESIVQYGIIQPITVRTVDGAYQIVSGERRWRAARMAGLSEIPVIITSADDKKAASIALVENIQRKDLNPIEEARAYSVLMSEYGLTQEEVAKQIGKSRTAITNSLRLLELPDRALELLCSGDISEGHAKVLLGIKDKSKISSAAETVHLKDLSVRDTEKLVKNINSEKPEPDNIVIPAVDYTKELERIVQNRIGRRVKIIQNGNKKSITIDFTDNEDLHSIIGLLCGEDILNSL